MTFERTCQIVGHPEVSRTSVLSVSSVVNPKNCQAPTVRTKVTPADSAQLPRQNQRRYLAG
jgi:hypothetical protein